MRTKSVIRPVPSPLASNGEQMFMRTQILSRSQLGLGQDSAAPSGSQLVQALRKKFGNDPKAVMRRLGLDADLLQSGGSDPYHDPERDDPTHKLRHAIEKCLDDHDNEVGAPEIPGSLLRRIYATLEGHRGSARDAEPDEEELLAEKGETSENIRRQKAGAHPKSDPRGTGKQGTLLGGPRRAGEDDDPPVIHPASRQNEGGKINVDDFADYLREHDLDEDVIDGALRIVRDGLRKRRSNGHDKHAARDRLPSHRAGRDDAEQKDKLNEMFPGLARIKNEPDVRRSRTAMDGAPASSAQRERLFQLIPEMRRIRHAADVGPDYPDPAHRNPYEV